MPITANLYTYGDSTPFACDGNERFHRKFAEAAKGILAPGIDIEVVGVHWIGMPVAEVTMTFPHHWKIPRVGVNVAQTVVNQLRGKGYDIRVKEDNDGPWSTHGWGM